MNWLLDKVPWGGWLWPVSAAQSTINAQKGDGLNEVDEQYARLVGATYGEAGERPYVIDHWKRQLQFDTNYVSVWDNPDGHRLIAVRGTQGSGTDIGEDILVGLTGQSTDVIGSDLLQILAATPKGMVVDLASHSLGTSLALQAYKNKTIYNNSRDLPVQPGLLAAAPRLDRRLRARRERAVLHQQPRRDQHGRPGAPGPGERRVQELGQPGERAQASAVAGVERLPGPDLPRAARDEAARAQGRVCRDRHDSPRHC